MTRYLGRKLLGLAIFVAVLVVGYNYFWGTPEEQQNAKEIVGQVKNLTSSVTKLLVSEKDKFDEGKYDTALSKMKDAVSVLKQKAMAMGDDGKKMLDSVNKLEQKEQDIEQQLKEINSEDKTPGGSAAPGDAAADRQARAESLRQQILELNQDAEELSQRLVF